jgi:hypothetical protein
VAEKTLADTIEELEARRYQAMLDADTATLRSLCHPQVTYSHSDAARDDLDSWLAKVDSGHFTYLTIERGTDQLLESDGTAVVIGWMKGDIELGGALRQVDNAACAVWTKSGEDWLLLCYQPTPFRR